MREPQVSCMARARCAAAQEPGGEIRVARLTRQCQALRLRPKRNTPASGVRHARGKYRQRHEFRLTSTADPDFGLRRRNCHVTNRADNGMRPFSESNERE